MNQRPWWEQWPGRLEREEQELRDRGIRFKRDDIAFTSSIAKYELVFEWKGKEYELLAIFSDDYPRTRFEVYSNDISLRHHQNLIDHNLCLFGRASINWNSKFLLGQEIAERLPKLLQIDENPDDPIRFELEEIQGEPISEHYRYGKNSMILMESAWNWSSEISSGTMVVEVESQALPLVWGAVKSVRSPDGTTLASSGKHTATLGNVEIPGQWYRVQDPIIAKDPDEFFLFCKSSSPTFGPRNHRS